MITILAYKRSGAQYSCNCLMESYSSDFDWASYHTKDGVIQHLANILFKNKTVEGPDYDITILRNGEDCNTWDEDGNVVGEDYHDLCAEVTKAAQEIADRKFQELKQAEAAANKALAIKQHEEKLERDRAMYENLKKQFGGDK